MRKEKIYVASSWRNELQPGVVERLRKEGYEVYDFRNPAPGDHGFQWSAIDSDWQQWTPEQFRDALSHPIAQDGFYKDMSALDDCDVCVLVMPCGRSAHLEAGYAKGAGKRTYILMPDMSEPELMYKMASNKIFTSLDDLILHINLISDIIS
jgi:nucleoside 2-deoxyribosyltransferase